MFNAICFIFIFCSIWKCELQCQFCIYFLHPRINLSEPVSSSGNGTDNISPETLTGLLWGSNGMMHMTLFDKLQSTLQILDSSVIMHICHYVCLVHKYVELAL